MIWRVLPLVKINTRISETPCIQAELKMALNPYVTGIYVNVNILRHF
jgi:hypothetical protein